MESDTDWTLLRPPCLLDQSETGVTVEALGAFTVRGKYTLARADLAVTILRKLGDPGSVRQSIEVAGA